MEPQEHQILLIEDSPTATLTVRQFLEMACDQAHKFVLHCAGSLTEGLERLGRGDLDLVLLDLFLPDSQGLETFMRVRAQASKVPIVLMTSLDDESVALEALKRGAQDYLVKGQADAKALSRVILYAMERKKLEQIKDEFVNIVSHELRTPMTIVKEAVAQIRDGVQGSINESQKEFLEMSIQMIDRLKRVIDDLLDVSKIEAGRLAVKRELVDAVKLVEYVISTFKLRAEARGIALRGIFSAPSLEIYADRDKLIQVFTNLVSNALKFTEKGSITLSVADRGECIECAVADTGPGISPENVQKLFGKFEQFTATPVSGEKGTGLGLAICKGLVELHNGKIWAESAVGQGTRFVFTLPKCSARQAFETYVTEAMTNAMKQNLPLSLAMVEIEDESEKGAPALPNSRDTKNLLKGLDFGLRPEWDVRIEDSGSFLLMYPFKAKKPVESLLEQLKNQYQALVEMKEASAVKLSFRCVGYPEDAKTETELLEKLFPRNANPR